MKQDDKALIERIIRKDEGALSTLFSRYESGLSYYVLRQIRNKEESEEIVQDVFIELIESLRNFRGDASLKTFIFSIARNKVIDAIRRKKIKRVLFSSLPESFVEGLCTVVLDDEIARRELTRRINTVVSQLPHDYQVVLRLKYMEQRKVRDIARALRLSFKAAESLIYRARRAFIILYDKTP